MQVDRRTVAVVIVGVLGALALAFAAATLTNSVSEGGGSLISIGGDSADLFQADEPRDPDLAPLPEVGPVLQAVIAVLLVLTIVTAVYILSIRDLVSVVIAVALAGIALWLLLTLLSALTGSEDDFGFGDVGAGLPTGSGGFGPQAGESASQSPLLLGTIGVVAVLALVILFGLSTDDRSTEPDSATEDDATPESLAPVGVAAGRAAERLEDEATTTSNAVYRAWVEMTDALHVENRQSTTPGEFADRAIEAGMKPRDVEELTALFEDVRYGDATVSAERERKATDALRRIESTYAGEER